jgi:hypothetical protein
MWQFEDYKEDIKTKNQVTRSKIHISYNLWISLNSFTILGVIIHFISKENKLTHYIITRKDIIEEHTNEQF